MRSTAIRRSTASATCSSRAAPGWAKRSDDVREFGDHPTREGIWVPATQVEAREVDAAEQSFGAIPALTHRGVRRKRSDVALTRFQPVTQPEGDRPDCP